MKVTPCPHSIPRAKFSLVHKLRFGFASWNQGCEYCRKYRFSPTIRKKEGQSCISYNIFDFIGINPAKIARNFVHITTLARPCSPFPWFCCTKCNIRYHAYEARLAPIKVLLLMQTPATQKRSDVRRAWELRSWEWEGICRFSPPGFVWSLHRWLSSPSETWAAADGDMCLRCDQPAFSLGPIYASSLRSSSRRPVRPRLTPPRFGQ